RQELLPPEKLGCLPTQPLTPKEHEKNNLPDILVRWWHRNKAERKNPRTAQSFCVPKSDIFSQGYDLSVNRYKEVIHAELEHQSPKEIIAALTKLELEIQQGIKKLEERLG